jgi:hypothetical protein
MMKSMASATLVLATAAAMLAPGRVAEARDPGAFAQMHHVEFIINTSTTVGAISPCPAIQVGMWKAATRGNLNAELDMSFTYLSGGESVTVSTTRRLIDMKLESQEDNNTVLVSTVIPGAPQIDAGTMVSTEITLVLLDQDGETVLHTFPTETATLAPEIVQGPALEQP